MATGPILKKHKADTINKELIETTEGFIHKNHTRALATIFDELQPAELGLIVPFHCSLRAART